LLLFHSALMNGFTNRFSLHCRKCKFVKVKGDWARRKFAAPHVRILGPRWKRVVNFAVGGWMGPRAGLDDLERWNIPCSCRDSNPRSPALSVVTLPTTLSRLPNEIQFCIYDNIMYVYLTQVRFCYHVRRSIAAILGRNFLCGSNVGLYYYYYYHHHHHHHNYLLYAGYLYIYSWNKQCP
jgi:hypothetical protein